MSVGSFFAKLESEFVSELKVVEADFAKVVAKIEPAAVSFLKQVSHDFLVTWMPEALQIVTNTLTSGQGITTATIGQMASQLEATALKDGGAVATQDSLTTIQMAVAHLQSILPALTASVAKPAA